MTTQKPHSTCTYLFVSFFAINTRFLDISCHVCGHSCESVEAYEVCQFTHVFLLGVLRSPVSGIYATPQNAWHLDEIFEIDMPLCYICIFLADLCICILWIREAQLFSRNVARFHLNLWWVTTLSVTCFTPVFLENYMRKNVGTTLKLRPMNYKCVLITIAKLYIELHGVNKLVCSWMNYVSVKFWN